MRIVAGFLRGRRLEAPSVSSTRPTADRVRESIFNVLDSLLQDKGWTYQDLSFLDAFAGSGALGIEALSRGAAEAAFIEQNPSAYNTLLGNIDRLGLKEQARPYRRSALKPGRPHGKYDVIFLDPPYEKGLCQGALAALDRQGWISEKSLVVIEAGPKENYGSLPGFTLLDQRLYGTTQVLFFEREALCTHPT